MKFTEEQLNNFDKAMLVQLFLAQQEQLIDIDKKLQLVLEQVAVLNQNRFGRSSEKLDADHQIAFIEVDGTIVFFNEAEAVASLDEADEEESTKISTQYYVHIRYLFTLYLFFMLNTIT